MKQTSKRFASMMLALGFIVASFIIFFDLIQPTYRDLTTLKGKQLSDENFLSSEKNIVAQVKKLVSQYESDTQMQTSLAQAMPSGPDVAGALAQVYGIAQNNSVTIQSMTFSAPVTSAPTSLSPRQQILKPAGTFAIQITATGSYEAFKNFLSQLETNIRIFDVSALSLQPAASGAANLASTVDLFNYSVTVNTYYQLK